MKNKKFKFKVGEYYKAVKLRAADDPFNPNSDFGNSKPYHSGRLVIIPEVNNVLCLYPISDREGGIKTSLITKIEGNIIYTLNSVYEVTKM